MTAQQIIDMAIERSNLNDEDLIPEAQILDYLTSFERRLYLFAARHNPSYFGREGNTSARTGPSDNWSLTTAPGNVAAVSKVEVNAVVGTVSGVTAGTDINIIDIRHPDDALSPRAYLRNRTVFEYNSELSTDSSNYVSRLKVFYSFLPSDRTDTTDSLDLPDEFNLMVVLPLAELFAFRDQRHEEAQAIGQQFIFELQNFVTQVTVYDEVKVRELVQAQAASWSITQDAPTDGR